MIRSITGVLVGRRKSIPSKPHEHCSEQPPLVRSAPLDTDQRKKAQPGQLGLIGETVPVLLGHIVIMLWWIRY